MGCFDLIAPQIFNIDEEHNALMERLDPGMPLKSLVRNGQDEEATRIIAQIILQLQKERPRLSSFRHISELAEALPLLQGHLDNIKISKAESLFRDLSADRSKDILLHGDLHHDNILASATSWKVIDPQSF